MRQSLVMTRHALVVARQPLVSVRQPLALARQRGSLVASMPVAAQAMSAIFEVLERRGLTRSRLGISRVTSDEALAGLWERAIALVGRPTLPLEVGLEMPLGAMGVVDYLAASSATVGAALTVTQRVFPLVAPGIQVSFEALGGGARRVVVVNQPPFPGQQSSDALVVGILLARLRQLATRPPAIPVVELTEPDGPGRSRWLELLAAPKVRFGARRAGLQLAPADWSIPLRHADARLLTTLQAAVVGVEHRTADALLVAVRALAVDRLPHQLTLDDAAPALGMSRRSLQRKLASGGTTLSRVVDEVRRDRAEQLVDQGLLTLAEVAARVGFAEPASFTRAWRRWFRERPSRRRAAPSGRAR